MKRISFLLAVCLIFVWQSAGAAPYKLIHAFKGGVGDGRTPTYSSSLIASGNVLYGMTEDGGGTSIFSSGVLFQINSDGSGEKIIHAFDGDSIDNMTGSKEDGALPMGTPVLDPNGSTIYGMTEQGGSNGYVGGTIFSVNTDRTGFKLLHNFGGLGDGWAPQGSLILSGTTLYGMTTSGGTNLGDDDGTIFSIQTDGSGYTVLHDFTIPGEGDPKGSLLLWGDTLYGMTYGSIFRIGTNGSDFLTVHTFTGATTDGGGAYGSLIRQGAYLYGMTSQGGASSVGTVFQLYLIGSQFHILHNFSPDEAHVPYGDLVASGSTLYGMTSEGVTNYHGVLGGSGAVFQIETNGDGYEVMHTFEYPALTSNNQMDGSVPYGSPMILGSELFGMTSLGGSSGTSLTTDDGGCIFALTLPASSGGGGSSGPPTISTTSPFPNGKVGTTYHEQLAATGGTAPYTWSVSAGHLPPGLTLSAAGVLGGKPTKGEIAAFTIKVTGHDKETSSQDFVLTVETPPTFVITTPKPAEKITTPTFTVTGTAADPVGGVAGVFYQLNGGQWTAAQSANGYENWTIPNLPLPADADVLSAYAVDTFGNASKTNTVKFTYFVTGPLIVQTVGSGSFTPLDNGKSFQIGATFPITAKPAKGFAFLDWTDGNGTVLTKEPALKFVMASNLTLIANFVASSKPNVLVSSGSTTEGGFEVMDGVSATEVYPGLYSASAGSGGVIVSGEQVFTPPVISSGAIRVSVAQSGLFSGKLNVGDDSLPFTGRFDASGTARTIIAGKVGSAVYPQGNIARSPLNSPSRIKTNLTANLHLDVGSQTISGEITDGTFVAQVLARRGAFSSTNLAHDYKGTYPVVISGAAGSSTASVASGIITVDAFGNVTFEATLTDGTHLTQTTVLSRDGYLPLYLQLPGRAGAESSSLWAWLQITNGTVRSLPTAATLITGMSRSPVQIISAVAATNQE